MGGDCWSSSVVVVLMIYTHRTPQSFCCFVQYKVEKLAGTGSVEYGLARLGHAGLYTFMTIMPATGVAMGYYGGTKYKSRVRT